MKTFKKITGIISLLLVTLQFSPAYAKKVEKKVASFQVKMDCHSCQAKIEKNIAFEKGVKDIKTDLKKQTVDITYRPDQTTPEKLKQAIVKLGYEVKVISGGKCPTQKCESSCDSKCEGDHHNHAEKKKPCCGGH